MGARGENTEDWIRVWIRFESERIYTERKGGASLRKGRGLGGGRVGACALAGSRCKTALSFYFLFFKFRPLENGRLTFL